MSKLKTFRAENAAGPVLIAVALSATVLSYMGIFRLGIAVDWPVWAAALLPAALDGMIIAGILQVLQATAAGTSKKYGWWLTMGGAVVSVAANALTATPAILVAVDPNWLAAVTHALPVITVVATLEAWLYMRRGSIHRATADAATAVHLEMLSAELVAEQAAHSASVAAGAKENDLLVKRIGLLERENAKVADAAATPATGSAGTARPTQKALASVPDLPAGEDRDARIIEMRAQGETVPSIVAALNTSSSTVKRVLKAAKPAAA